MQGGEDRCRGGGRLNVVIVACVAAILCSFSRGWSATVWRSAVCGARLPDAVWRPPGVGGGSMIGCFVAWSNPYGLDGVTKAGVVAFADRTAAAASVGWEAVRFSLYCRDRLEGTAIVRWPRRLCFAGISASAHRAAVRGFNPETGGDWRVVGGGALGPLQVGVSMSPGESAGWRASLSIGSCRFIVDTADRRDPVVAGEYRRGAFSMHAGLRSDTGEAAVGVTARRRETVAGATWANHPFLGSTVTVFAGWLTCPGVH